MKIVYFGKMVKVGNSYSITIPKDIRTALELNKGDFLRIEIKKAKIE